MTREQAGYQRSEKALVSTLAEMYIEGVSTRKVKKITEELCGLSFSASAISAVVAKLDEQLEAFARRRLEEPYPYLVLDARYEKVREGGVIASQAVLVAVGIGADGRRAVLGVEEELERDRALKFRVLSPINYARLPSPSSSTIGCRAGQSRHSDCAPKDSCRRKHTTRQQGHEITCRESRCSRSLPVPLHG